MRCAKVVAPVLLGLAAGCSSTKPSFEWFPSLAETHSFAAPASDSLLSGFDAPVEGVTPAPGDKALYALQLDTPEGTTRWLLLFAVEPEDPEQPGRVQLAITVFDADAKQLACTKDSIELRHLMHGLFPGAEALRDTQEAVHHRLETVGDSLMAMLAFLNAIRDNEQLGQILWQVVQKPSVWSILVHLGVSTDITLSASEPWPHPLGPDAPDLPAYRVPMSIELNGTPALRCSIVVVRPWSPFAICAGITSVVAERPDDSGVRFRMRMVAARRAADVTDDAPPLDDRVETF